MLNTLLFYGILLPISYLPIQLLYGLADFVHFVLYHIIGYRKKVVLTNLRNSFPEKSDKEIKLIAKKFYKHLADIFIEAILNLRLSQKKLFERYRCTNSEILLPYYESGKSIILMSAHYNNWEYMITTLEHQIKHHGVGVGKELSNKTLDKYLNKYRTRYGTEVVFATKVRDTFDYYNRHNVPIAYMMLSDQSPNNINKCFWTTFMNQETGFIFGAEHFAKKYNFPVFYYDVQKVKRGYYEITFHLITEQPTEEAHGYITKRYVELLEETIKRKPEYWLWSHRRWKHKKTNITI